MEEEIFFKNLTKYYIFRLFACFNSQIGLKTLKKKVRKKTYLNPTTILGAMAGDGDGVENGYSCDIIRDLETYEKIFY